LAKSVKSAARGVRWNRMKAVLRKSDDDETPIMTLAKTVTYITRILKQTGPTLGKISTWKRRKTELAERRLAVVDNGRQVMTPRQQLVSLGPPFLGIMSRRC
jgi:hypothetical protein